MSQSLSTMKARFEQAIPNVSFDRRVRSILGEQFWRGTLKSLGMGGLVERPSRQVLRSNSEYMAKWFDLPYGTTEKPQSLAEIPWDYVESHQEEIPFLGLREYWYPALRSGELGNNEAKPVLLLGDNLVMFRDAQGKPCTLLNRCPHRGVLLSLGQVGVWEPGTLTCRYHGMTFDGAGQSVAFLTDGPDSPACGKINARAYPTTEQAGVIWVYMGSQTPKPLMESLPHASSVLGSQDAYMVVNRMDDPIPYSYLSMLDNTVDMTHVGCLHRTCFLFGDQPPYGLVEYEELEGGLKALLVEPDDPKHKARNRGSRRIDEIEWFLPNLVYHGPHELGGNIHGGWFWFVPRDLTSFWAWQIISMNVAKAGKTKAKVLGKVLRMGVQSKAVPGVACFLGGDAPMQMSQGKVPRWDLERLARTDRAVVRVRQMMRDAHKAECAARAALGSPAPRIQRRVEA